MRRASAARSSGTSATVAISSRSSSAAESCSSRQRAAGQRVHLERALDALPIGRRDPRRGGGSTRCEPRVQRRPAELARLRVELVAHRRVGARQARETFAQRAQIEQRAADEQRQPTASRDARDGRRRVASETARGVRARSARRCRSDGAARARGRPRRASPCRCRGRDRPSPNPCSRSRRRTRSATASASSVLPHAVGPVRHTQRGADLGPVTGRARTTGRDRRASPASKSGGRDCRPRCARSVPSRAAARSSRRP